jgi:DNA-binding SARP family transcriptional activator
MKHHRERRIDRLWAAIHAAHSAGGIPHLRWWLREAAPYVLRILNEVEESDALRAVVAADPRFWNGVLVRAIGDAKPRNRSSVVEMLERTATEETLPLIREVRAPELDDLRRQLVQQYADRLHIRTLGGLAVFRGGWDASAIFVTRRRARLLLGLLVVNFEGGLVRDRVIDLLWPDSDPAAGINSLNQTVFQLRRLIDPSYREGESPQYILSTVEIVQLNPALVITDLWEARRLARTVSEGNPAERKDAAPKLVNMIRGEFLSDLKYEDWVSEAQVMVHAEVRAALMPLLTSTSVTEPDTQIRAACALATLDPFDEVANIAVAQRLAESGRRAQARAWIQRYARRVRDELEEEPSREVVTTAALVGTAVD